MPEEIAPVAEPGSGGDTPPSAPEPGSMFRNDDLEKSLSKAFGVEPEIEEPKKEVEPKGEPKVEPEPELKPEPDPEPKKDDVPDTSKKAEEVRKLSDVTPPHPDDLKPPKNVGERSLEGWNVLHKSYKNLFNVTKQREDAIKQLKTALAEKDTGSKGEAEKLRKEIDELKAYRAMIDVQADPDFQSKYETPLSQMKSELESILEKNGVSKQVIQSLDFTNTELMDAIALQLEERRDRITSKRFLSKSEDFIKLHEEKQKALADQKTNFKQYQENRDKQTFAQQAAEQGAISQHVQAVAAVKDREGKDVFPFLVMKEAPVGASQAEIAKIEAHNDMVSSMNKKLEGVLAAKTPQEKAEVGIAAISASFYKFQWDQAQKKVAQLTEQLSKFNAAGSERKPNAGAATYKVTDNMNAADAISAAFPNMR